jgi:hypothetical protein
MPYQLKWHQIALPHFPLLSSVKEGKIKTERINGRILQMAFP